MWRNYFLLLGLAIGARITDLVRNLPGLPDTPNFDMYSGYLDIPNSNGKYLHYVMALSQNKPDQDPLVLWLNGGPGCSSLDGFFYEHGPYVFPEGSKELARNPYSWNRNATVVYLEAPAGVGFSILGELSNNRTDDLVTAHDNLQAILQLFKLFPEFANNDFYITGESYAGIYVPTLAYNILMHNSYAPNDVINLKGIAVGNACTDWTVDTTPAFIKMAWSHGLLWWDQYANLTKFCDNLNNFNTLECADYIETLETTLLENINIYNIYGKCQPGEKFADVNRKKLQYLNQENKLKVVPPCVEYEGIYDYLRNDTVRLALHIPTYVQQYELCTDMDYIADYKRGSLYVYPFLIRSGLRIWVYSGDVDGAVPFVGTREWIQKLNIGRTQEYTRWYVNGQVAGYYEEYEGLTFVTIKGAGHMVPQDKPAEAWEMINSFLNGNSP